ncbi:hypothetical protein NDU88_001474 [Pleurodeles waltl]|uniref:Uncharacterized protein n=1 Tax=Pleurodeles waltl TaxID=8319 RepID=A0AAV7NCP6_PLEWA|nr:hypothetical protein NDU88_001474 [Pleurodeles waltl]
MQAPEDPLPPLRARVRGGGLKGTRDSRKQYICRQKVMKAIFVQLRGAPAGRTPIGPERVRDAAALHTLGTREVPGDASARAGLGVTSDVCEMQLHRMKRPSPGRAYVASC